MQDGSGPSAVGSIFVKGLAAYSRRRMSCMYCAVGDGCLCCLKQSHHPLLQLKLGLGQIAGSRQRSRGAHADGASGRFL